MATYGEIRRALADSGARWQTIADVEYSQQVPTHPLGAVPPENLRAASEVPELDFATLLADNPTHNPYLNARRVALGFVDAPVRPEIAERARPLAGTGEAGISAEVDW